jgi:DNA adenine methylase
MPPDNFAVRVNDWHERVAGTIFKVAQYQETMSQARPGDIVYCDPPYSHSQAILYGAQSFDLDELMSIIGACKKRNVYVALSIDGKKKSGNLLCHIKMPKGLFEREVFIDIGRSMLKRFQMNGKTLEKEIVADRLLLTF